MAILLNLVKYHTGEWQWVQRARPPRRYVKHCHLELRGLSHTQRDLCGQLGYDILALTETHDSGCIRSTKQFITGDTAPRGNPCAGVAMLLSDRIAERLYTVVAAGRVLSTPEFGHYLATCLWCVCMYRIVPDKIRHNQTH